MEEKISFERGVEERRSNSDSGDERNDELTGEMRRCFKWSTSR